MNINTLLFKLYHSLTIHAKNIAFQLEEKTWTYQELLAKSAAIRNAIREEKTSQSIGLHLSNDFEMYASLLAIWFEGKTYVPIHPEFPIKKVEKILEQAECSCLISSLPNSDELPTVKIIDSKNTIPTEFQEPNFVNENSNAYILFTSGSTGEPKGVPITFSNLYHFTEAYYEAFGEISERDNVLQMFELNFDMSVVSYLIPWLNGAKMVGLHNKEVKFLQIMDLLEENKITVAQLVPSIANLMLPYLDPNIKNQSLRSVFFAGEALLEKTINEWRNFVPNATIYNAYGPTENTIICSFYEIPWNAPKQKNGILSIGKQMKNNTLRFLDDNTSEGELLLGGHLLTPHYWKNPEKDREAFIEIDGNRYYKTGDWCERDENQNYFYINRIDFQTKINGYRVELSEIEHFANQICKQGICIALAVRDENENDIIILVSDDDSVNTETIANHLKNNIPNYMMPSKIVKMTSFPYTSSGKVDRKMLKNQFQ